ncbi:hypothetical protein RIF29_34745 [Crotalaria pallida]|uniref:Uncharacterized protein n=1 Tax=Crotalaria pallida TaxID=3830 RepID=A0AAN9EBV4_CROPI
MGRVRGSRKRKRYDQNVSTTAASGSTMNKEPQDESSRRKNDITWQFVESMEQKGFEHLKRPSTEIDMKGTEKLNGIPNSNRVIDVTHFNLCLTSTKPSFNVWLDHNKYSMVMNAIVYPESVYKIGELGCSPLPSLVVPYGQKVREDILMEQSSIGFFKEKTNTEYPGTHVRVSTKGSCAPAPELADDDLDFTDLCKLYVEDPNLRSVAYEKMHDYSTTIHHKPIEEFPRPEPDIDHLSSLRILAMIMNMDKSIIEIRLPSVITGLQETTISYINHGDINELCSDKSGARSVDIMSWDICSILFQRALPVNGLRFSVIRNHSLKKKSKTFEFVGQKFYLRLPIRKEFAKLIDKKVVDSGQLDHAKGFPVIR